MLHHPSLKSTKSIFALGWQGNILLLIPLFLFNITYCYKHLCSIVMTFRFAVAIFFTLYIYSLTKKIATAKRMGIKDAHKSLITDIMSQQVSLWEGRFFNFAKHKKSYEVERLAEPVSDNKILKLRSKNLKDSRFIRFSRYLLSWEYLRPELAFFFLGIWCLLMAYGCLTQPYKVVIFELCQ